MTFYRDEKRNNAIQGNVMVNAVGVFFFFFLVPLMVRALFFARCQNLLVKLC